MDDILFYLFVLGAVTILFIGVCFLGWAICLAITFIIIAAIPLGSWK